MSPWSAALLIRFILRVSRRIFPFIQRIRERICRGKGHHGNVDRLRNRAQEPRVKDIPVEAFWSVSVYNAAGYFEKNPYDAYTLNNISTGWSEPIVSARGAGLFRRSGQPSRLQWLLSRAGSCRFFCRRQPS